MIHLAIPLDEILRPTQLDDLLLPETVLTAFTNMIDRNECMNMLFHGAPGTGKTSAARLFVESLTSNDGDFLICNGAGELDPIEFRTRLTTFVSSVSFSGNGKVCIIDEAEFLPPKSQAILRALIEDMFENCRFILTANDITRLQPAVRSRLHEISFDIRVNDAIQMRNKVERRLREKLAGAGRIITDEILQEAMGSFPHMRRVTKAIEFSLLTSMN